MEAYHVRPLTSSDIPDLVAYWTQNDPEFMRSMGVDLQKVPAASEVEDMLHHQLSLPVQERSSYALVWTKNEQAIGHSNVNPFKFGGEGWMHLHLWKPVHRQKGIGTYLVRKSVSHFLQHLKLNALYSQPYALNPAPHRCLEKAGFRKVKEYVTTPGAVNFEQPVILWQFPLD